MTNNDALYKDTYLAYIDYHGAPDPDDDPADYLEGYEIEEAVA